LRHFVEELEQLQDRPLEMGVLIGIIGLLGAAGDQQEVWQCNRDGR